MQRNIMKYLTKSAEKFLMLRSLMARLYGNTKRTQIFPDIFSPSLAMEHEVPLYYKCAREKPPNEQTHKTKQIQTKPQ